MDGKTKGLIVGKNFVIDEYAIVAVRLSPPIAEDLTRSAKPGYVEIFFNCAAMMHVIGEDAAPLFDRIQQSLRMRYLMNANVVAVVSAERNEVSMVGSDRFVPYRHRDGWQTAP